MKKTLFYKLFGLGKIPVQYGARLETEGVVLADEGVKGTTTLLNFRSPNRRSNWRREWYTASIAMTRVSLLGFRYSGKIIDVPFADRRFGQLDFSVDENGALLIAFDAGLFHDDWSGRIEYRFFTPHEREFLDKLTEKQKPLVRK